MSIRSTAKALIIHNGKALLNKCRDVNNGEYYALPGGGQNKYETLHEALVRECKEETGYEVNPIKLIGVCEAICMHEEFREKLPEYAHKMFHIFLCGLANDSVETPTETDSMQVGTEWVDVDTLHTVRLFPKSFGGQISDILSGTAPVFLGSERVGFNHG